MNKDNLTPGQAIRKHCIACVGSAAEVEYCDGDEMLGGGSCPLYPYRLGKGRPSVKVIRQECLNCMSGNRNFIRNCLDSSCNLYSFRMGTNPNYTRRKISPKRWPGGVFCVRERRSQ